MAKARKLFTTEDDAELVQLVGSFGDGNWSQIAQGISAGFTSRQCRERWRNYLDPRLQHTAWTDADDRRLLDEYARIGTKWTILAAMFPGRSGNAVRNRLLLLLRKKEKPIDEVVPVAPLRPAPQRQEPHRPFCDVFGIGDQAKLAEMNGDECCSFFFAGD
jgi:hypothetical protein